MCRSLLDLIGKVILQFPFGLVRGAWETRRPFFRRSERQAWQTNQRYSVPAGSWPCPIAKCLCRPLRCWVCGRCWLGVLYLGQLRRLIVGCRLCGRLGSSSFAAAGGAVVVAALVGVPASRLAGMLGSSALGSPAADGPALLRHARCLERRWLLMRRAVLRVRSRVLPDAPFERMFLHLRIKVLIAPTR